MPVRAVLTYHSIDDSGSPISVDAASFRRHVQWLANSGVQVTTPEELLRLPPSADAVALTFDDGFASFADLAWPLLRDHGIPATVYVVSDFVGASNRWQSRTGGVPHLPLLDWASLTRLVDEGAEVGSHSRTHPDMRTLAPAALAEEAEGAASRIEAALGRRPTSFVYPYGLYDQRVVAAVRTSYRVALTTELRVLGELEDPALVPRLDAYYFRSPGTLEAWGTGRFRRRLWLRAGMRRMRDSIPDRCRTRRRGSAQYRR